MTAAPTLPPAPARFSTTTDAPLIALVVTSAYARAAMSVLLPAENGTRNLIGRSG
ncbi:Uncharacterised protein [Bordetella pertussis]|nr:Uncharacterised protein [Bordetella pertussis]